MLQGYGGAEECQHCGTVYCDACYPQRENVCTRCGRRELRLVLVLYVTGNSAYWARRVPAVESAPLGTKWAIDLRRFLAARETDLSAAQDEAAGELGRLRGRGMLRRLVQGPELRALEAIVRLVRTLIEEDISQASVVADVAERWLRRCGRLADADSVSMVRLDWRIRLAQSFMTAPRPLQRELLQAGLAACEKCVAIARSLQDPLCTAEYLTRLGNGLYSAGRYDDSAEAFQSALWLWRGLAAADSRYRLRVARGLQHLGTVYSEKAEHVACHAAYREAIELLDREPEGRRDLMDTLNNLGTFHLLRQELADAEELIVRACEIAEGLLSSGRSCSADDPHGLMLRFDLSRLRGNLGICLVGRGEERRGETILEEVIAAQMGFVPLIGDAARMQAARSQGLLGSALLGRWRRESGCREDADRTLLREAIDHLAAALQAFTRQWQQGGGLTSDHLESCGRIAVDLAIARAYDGNLTEALACLEFAEQGSTFAAWRWQASLFNARRMIEEIRSGDPLAGFDHALAAVQAVERAMRALSSAEVVHRDLMKREVETCYLTCMANYARQGRNVEAFHMMEALRRIDRLAVSQGGSQDADRSLGEAQALASELGFTYLAIQGAPGGAVFLLLSPRGEAMTAHAPKGWSKDASEFAQQIEDAIVGMGKSGQEPAGEPLRRAGEALFTALPDGVRQALTTASGDVFLSMGGDQQNLPIEALFEPQAGWLGLQRTFSRVSSFEELAGVIRRSTTKASAAIVAAGPGQFHAAIQQSSNSIAGRLEKRAIRLAPGAAILEGKNLTRWKLLDAMDGEASLIVFVGHGDQDARGGLLLVAGGERIRPTDLAELRLRASPIVHLECCCAGRQRYSGGGFAEGFGITALASGAACCLVSNRVILGEASNMICEALYERLVGDAPERVADALLAARRAVAAKHAHPLYWSQPVLFGNPNVRLL
jgi:tetratricopeptide (TPR) repeat protein